MVASCSPSLHETTFRQALARAGANPYVYEQANLREQVSWVHHGAEATEKATPAGGRGRGQGRQAQAPGTHPGRGRSGRPW